MSPRTEYDRVAQDARAASTSARRTARLTGQQILIRTLIIVNLGLGLYYLTWRYTDSINWHFWPLALLLLAAETFSYIDTLLLGTTMWRWRRRGAPPRPRGDETVDVFITTYNEPVEVVRATVRAAVAITHPHRTFVLDDGESAELRAMAEEEGAHYIVRGDAWQGRERHAKAGNLNNALYQTDGAFILIQDADQIPHPAILDRTLGYFRDPSVAFVQTPQWFRNVPESDPFGSQAPLFYGPIQEGKDGWNAAFFCGSNAVLRREALVQGGMVNLNRDHELHIRRMLTNTIQSLEASLKALDAQAPRGQREVIAALRDHTKWARNEMTRSMSLPAVISGYEDGVAAIAERALANAAASGQWVSESPLTVETEDFRHDLRDLYAGGSTMTSLAARKSSALSAVAATLILMHGGESGNDAHEMAMTPIATISVTEDMATAMRLHALGWKSVFHPEILATGLAPEDIGAAMKQRLRWSQGTLQVMLMENPLRLDGLNIGQRLSYFATMWSYLSGIPTLIYLLAPVLFLLFGWTPVNAYSSDFFRHLLPYLIVNQVLFLVISRGLSTWRGQQYSVALFPVWINAMVSAFRSVWFGKELSFLVTPKAQRERQTIALVWPQALAAGLLTIAVGFGLTKLAMGLVDDGVPVAVNVLWALYDLAALSVLVGALRHRPGTGEMQTLPESIPTPVAAAPQQEESVVVLA